MKFDSTKEYIALNRFDESVETYTLRIIQQILKTILDYSSFVESTNIST